MNHIESLFGRLLVLVLYCSVFISTNTILEHHRLQVAKKKAEMFISEVRETGIQNELCDAFLLAQAKLGYVTELSLESPTRPMNHHEILSFILTTPLELQTNEFFTCRLSSGKYVLRVGG